jgi:hypothetical protein
MQNNHPLNEEPRNDVVLFCAATGAVLGVATAVYLMLPTLIDRINSSHDGLINKELPIIAYTVAALFACAAALITGAGAGAGVILINVICCIGSYAQRICSNPELEPDSDAESQIGSVASSVSAVSTASAASIRFN